MYYNSKVAKNTSVSLNDYNTFWSRRFGIFFVIFEPLEQFEVIQHLANFNSSAFIMFAFCFFLFFKSDSKILEQPNIVVCGTTELWWFRFIYNRSILSQKQLRVRSSLLWLIQTLFLLVFSVVEGNVLTKFQTYVTYVFIVFIFIFVSNIVGLIPYSFTLTSSFVVTSFISWSSLIGITIIGIFSNKWKFFNILLPQGSPFEIAPLIVVLELISYIAKGFSLSIRLFANMMSGHALLKILIGFAWTLLTSLQAFWFIPWLIVYFVTAVEFFIAFLQSYVFIVLVSIYLNDCINIH